MSFDAEAVRQFERTGWDRAAATYGGSFAHATRAFVPALLEGITPGDRVLDVCCGTGVVTAALAAAGADPTGLDFSAGMLAEARAGHPGLRFDEGDAESLPHADASFDAVVSNFGIHHVPHPQKALAEARRVLRAGGRMAFTIWAAPAENVAWKLVFDAIRACGDPTASRAPPPGGGFASAEACVAALEAAGFVDIAAQPLRSVWHHRDGAALLQALGAGTARMAALIGAQDPARLPAIAAAIDTAAEMYRGPEGLALPLAAIVARGRRPGMLR
ncbi:MAG: methyltransferase domain-containing protein [Rhodospirillales bacterium]|nr:methyltransferase domain-containing protein [Rhodospirillales bacterium]